MGLVFGKNRHIHVLVIGINSAGKTSLVYRLKFGEEVLTLPTVGYQTETIKLQQKDRIKFDMIDIGGASPIRSLWKQFYNKCEAIIYVVDASNRDTMNESAQEFSRIRKEKGCKRIPVLLFANKQDLPNAASVSEICDAFHVKQDKNKCHVQPCCATSGTGIDEGMEWLKTSLGFA